MKKLLSAFILIFTSAHPLFSESIIERTGNKIDSLERKYFRLFPDTEEFKYAEIIKTPDAQYKLKIHAKEDNEIPLSQDAVNNLRKYINNIENLIDEETGDKLELDWSILNKLVNTNFLIRREKGKMLRYSLNIRDSLHSTFIRYANDNFIVISKHNNLYDWKDSASYEIIWHGDIKEIGLSYLFTVEGYQDKFKGFVESKIDFSLIDYITAENSFKLPIELQKMLETEERKYADVEPKISDESESFISSADFEIEVSAMYPLNIFAPGDYIYRVYKQKAFYIKHIYSKKIDLNSNSPEPGLSFKFFGALSSRFKLGFELNYQSQDYSEPNNDYMFETYWVNLCSRINIFDYDFAGVNFKTNLNFFMSFHNAQFYISKSNYLLNQLNRIGYSNVDKGSIYVDLKWGYGVQTGISQYIHLSKAFSLFLRYDVLLLSYPEKSYNYQTFNGPNGTIYIGTLNYNSGYRVYYLGQFGIRYHYY